MADGRPLGATIISLSSPLMGPAPGQLLGGLTRSRPLPVLGVLLWSHCETSTLERKRTENELVQGEPSDCEAVRAKPAQREREPEQIVL